MLQSIQNETEKLRSLVSQELRLLQEKEIQFTKNFLDPLKKLVSQKLKEQNYQISQPFFDKLSLAVKNRKDINELAEWLECKEIKYEDLLIKHKSLENYEAIIKENAEKLNQRILENAPSKTQEYQNADANYGFQQLFKQHFYSRDENLDKINIDDIEKKILYIENQYFYSLKSIEDEISLLKQQLERLNDMEKKIKTIIEIYKNKIREHWRKIITDIEIPFFIYSGKILQNIQSSNCAGIFLKDPSSDNELKNIRFVSNVKGHVNSPLFCSQGHHNSPVQGHHYSPLLGI